MFGDMGCPPHWHGARCDGILEPVQVVRMVGESQEAVGAGAAAGAAGGPGANKTPTLEEFGTDLTKQAAEGKLDPVIGRAKEVERVTQVRQKAPLQLSRVGSAAIRVRSGRGRFSYRVG